MPPYGWIHFEALLFMVGIGLGLTLLIALARGSRFMAFSFRARPPQDEETHSFADGLEEANRPVPWLIWLVFVGYFVWAVAYVFYCSAHGA